jgi:hypothetical protein
MFKPANLGTEGRHATSRPPKPLAPLDGRITMSSESVCQVVRSWVVMGSLHMCLVVRLYDFYSVSPEYFGYTLVNVFDP